MDPEPEMTAVLERQLSRAGGSTAVSETGGRPSVESTRSGLPVMAEAAGEMSDVERREMDQALAASRQEQDVNMDAPTAGNFGASTGASGQDDELERALAESRRQVEVDERRRRESMNFSSSDAVGAGSSAGGLALAPALPIRRETDRLTSQMQGMDLMSDDGAQGSTQRPLEPIRTGTNNPFASANSVPASPMNSNYPRTSTNPFENPSYESNGPAGSSHTSYAPPAGPPPGWQSSSQPPSANPFLQPQHGDAPPPVAPKPARPNDSGMNHGAGILTHQLGLTQSRQDGDASSNAKRYDMVILVDDSGSMAGGRWRETRMALMEVAEQAAGLDSDGIDVHFINDSAVGEGLRVSLGDCPGLGLDLWADRRSDCILERSRGRCVVCAGKARRSDTVSGVGLRPLRKETDSHY